MALLMWLREIRMEWLRLWRFPQRDIPVPWVVFSGPRLSICRMFMRMEAVVAASCIMTHYSASVWRWKKKRKAQWDPLLNHNMFFMLRANGDNKIVLVSIPKIQKTWARTNLSVIINQSTSYFLNLFVIASKICRYCENCFSKPKKTFSNIQFFSWKHQNTHFIIFFERKGANSDMWAARINSHCKSYVVYLSNL